MDYPLSQSGRENTSVGAAIGYAEPQEPDLTSIQHRAAENCSLLGDILSNIEASLNRLLGVQPTPAPCQSGASDVRTTSDDFATNMREINGRAARHLEYLQQQMGRLNRAV